MKLDARILALFLGVLGGVALLGPAQEDAGSEERGAFAESAATANKDLRSPVDMPVPVPPASEKAMQYYRSGNWLWLLQLAWGLVVPAAFVFTGFSARLRTWAQSIGRWWYVVLCVYLVLFFLVNYLLEWPLAYYTGFVRQHAYGLSNQTFAKWQTDSLIKLMASIIIGWLLLWIPYLLLRKSPRRWWVYSGLLLAPVLFVGMLVKPLVFDPLFNTFGPMKDKALEGEILALAERAGIEGSRVFEVDKSIDTKAVNAYVTGFGNTKRIVLWDTIIAKLDRDELLFVMGHEMGHYVLNHITKGILFYSGLGLAALYCVHRLAQVLLRRYHARFGFGQIHDIASLPLLLLCINVVSLVLTPLALAHSRYQEHEADRFGIEMTQTNRAAATGFVKLLQENLANPRPGPFYRWWRGTHPSIGDRIDFFNSYFPWKSGDTLRYGHYFRPTKPVAQ